MLMPYLQPTKAKANMQDKFLGLNDHVACDPAQFRDMRNLSSDRYPVMGPRKQRRLVRTFEHATALMGGAELTWVEDGQLYFDGEAVCAVSSERPQLVRMGAYLIVWPDRIIYNTHTKELVAMDAVVSAAGASVRPCTLTGADLPYTADSVPPESPAEQDYWWNTDTKGLYQYLGGEWQGIETVYSRIDIPGIAGKYHDYDVVKLEGFSYEGLNLEAATVYVAKDAYIVIATGELMDYTETGTIKISRKAPELDFICESGNRLWGCSSRTHEIRGCKLGDPTNWSSYLGISTDSYAATVGSAGDFTGIYQYMGYVHFFKENCVHRLYGTRPENYQLIELPIRGVKAGCERSLCTVNQILYYVSRDGVMAFDGSSPVEIGDAIGDVTFSDCVCGAHENKLYLSAVIERGGGKTGVRADELMAGPLPTNAQTSDALLYAMDTGKGLWHIEDDTRCVAFAETPEGDFMLTDTGGLWLIDGGHSRYETMDASDEPEIEWWGITGDIGMDSPNQKWIKRLTLRLGMERGARLSVDIMYDSDGRWIRAMSIETERKKSLTLPIRTRRCDHFCLRYSGIGNVEIYSVAKTYDEASERMTLVRRR